MSKLVLIVGPSGSGKGTVIEELKKRHPEFVYPVSCTTRAPRANEIPGTTYNYISEEEFKKNIENGEFLEWAEVHKQSYYGTLKKPILEALESGKMVVREVDIQGFKSIKNIFSKEQLLSIFLISSLDELKARILHRGPMSDEELARRMQSATNEMNESVLCDFKVKSPQGKIKEITDEVEKIILS
ncbi:MAG: guanylate kinase [Candidatus Gracilibacteria bacterium]|jgi:guanylate kinase